MSDMETVWLNLVPGRFNDGALYLRSAEYGGSLRPECALECEVIPDPPHTVRLVPVAFSLLQEALAEMVRLKGDNIDLQRQLKEALSGVKT